MIYACEVCHFLFKRVGEPEQCPDCGKYSIRPTNEDEKIDSLTEINEYEKVWVEPISNDATQRHELRGWYSVLSN